MVMLRKKVLIFLKVIAVLKNGLTKFVSGLTAGGIAVLLQGRDKKVLRRGCISTLLFLLTYI